MEGENVGVELGASVGVFFRLCIRVNKCDVLAFLFTNEIRSLVDVRELRDSFQNDVDELNVEGGTQESEQRRNLFFFDLFVCFE